MAYETIKRSSDSAVSEISSKADQVAGWLSSATENVAYEAEGRLNDAGKNLGSVYTKGTDRAREKFDELPATLSDVSVAGERLIRRVDHSVRKQPVEALLLAGALGYLAGWAISQG